MNSTPAASKAILRASRVEERLGGIPSKVSNRLIVRTPTPDLFANSSTDHRRPARAERICDAVIIDSGIAVAYMELNGSESATYGDA